MSEPIRTALFRIHGDPDGLNTSHGIPAVWARYSISTTQLAQDSFAAEVRDADGSPRWTAFIGRTEPEAFGKALARLQRLAEEGRLTLEELP